MMNMKSGTRGRVFLCECSCGKSWKTMTAPEVREIVQRCPKCKTDFQPNGFEDWFTYDLLMDLECSGCKVTIGTPGSAWDPGMDAYLLCHCCGEFNELVFVVDEHEGCNCSSPKCTWPGSWYCMGAKS